MKIMIAKYEPQNFRRRLASCHLVWSMAALACAFLVSSSSAWAAIPQNAFQGDYWNLPSTSGVAPVFPTTAPTLTRTDAAINFNWGSGAPMAGINVDDFAVRWQGTWTFASSGVYEFTVTTNDGLRLSVDGAQILNQWKDQVATYTVQRSLSAGSHLIRVEHYENAGGAQAKLSWRLLPVVAVPAAGVTATATQTSSSTSRWTTLGTDKYTYYPYEWLEYLCDFGAGGSWLFSLTATNYPYPSAPGLPAGYAYSLDLWVDGSYQRTFSVPGSTTTYQTGATTSPLALSGLHTVRFMWTNDAYSPGVYDANIRVKQIGVSPAAADTTPPTGTVTINAGAAYTKTPTVTLTLSASDASGVSQMRFSNDNLTYAPPIGFYAVAGWTLTSGDGTKTVSAQFKDAAGNWSTALISDTILLDTTKPTISGVAATAITASSTTVTWTTNEAATSQVDYGLTTSYGQTTPLDATLLTSHSVALSGLSAGTFYHARVRSKDAAGNEQLSADATFTTASGSDTIPPTGTVTINTGASYTKTTAVTLTLSATDASGTVAQMQCSNDNVTYSAAEAYATTKSWTLSSGDGPKTVYAKFKDAAGNWSAAVSDTITLDSTPPALTFTSPVDQAVLGAQ